MRSFLSSNKITHFFHLYIRCAGEREVTLMTFTGPDDLAMLPEVEEGVEIYELHVIVPSTQGLAPTSHGVWKVDAARLEQIRRILAGGGEHGTATRR